MDNGIRILPGIIRRQLRKLSNLIYNTKHMLAPIPYKPSDDGRETVFIMIHALSGGGAERVASIIASALARKYHVVAVCLTKMPNEYYVDENVVKIYVPKFEGFLGQIVRYRIKFINRLKRKLDPALSISLLYSMNRYNVPSKQNDIVVCCERNNPFKNEANRIEEIKDLYEKADHVVFQTETIQALFGEKIAAHSTILPNPISVTCERDCDPKPRIVNVGRLNRQKNQKMLFRAFSRFVESYPEYTLSVYGEGPIRDELQEYISSLGMQDRIFLHGRVTDVHREMRDAEIFVLSSDYEGMPNALLESMLMGFPCISTSCEGARNIIRDGENGILTEVGNEDELLQAMLTLAGNGELRQELGRNAKTTAEQFRSGTAVESWLELADRLISGRSENNR